MISFSYTATHLAIIHIHIQTAHNVSNFKWEEIRQFRVLLSVAVLPADRHMSTTLFILQEMSVPVVLQNFIDGQFVNVKNADFVHVINPANGEVLAHVPKSTIEDLNQAVAAAKVDSLA